MTIQEILALTNPADIIKELQKVNTAIQVPYETSKKQYDPSLHDIMDLVIRPNKTITTPTGEKNTKGEDVSVTSTVAVARIAVPFQKILVNRTVSFLLNEGIDIRTDAEALDEIKFIDFIKRIWDDNKLDSKSKQLARLWMSECEAAELWYFTKEENFWLRLLEKLKLKKVVFRARVKILSPSLGDKLYPYFDESGDMVAFSREFTVASEGKSLVRFEIYTTEKIIHYTSTDGLWEVDEGYPAANPIGKIPIVYYSREYPLWHDVQALIDRYEVLMSNFADSNDYFGSPMIVVKGKVNGFATKGEQGKILEVEGDGDVNYLTWPQGPESIKLELETLQNMIYSLTQVPDISFSQMSKLGNMSGISRKLMFLDIHLKCFNELEVFEEMIQRRLNLLKAMVGKVVSVNFAAISDSVELWPGFTPYLPSAEEELITSLSTAAGGKPIISQKTAVKLNPYLQDEDADAEIKQIQDEESVMNQEAVI